MPVFEFLVLLSDGIPFLDRGIRNMDSHSATQNNVEIVALVAIFENRLTFVHCLDDEAFDDLLEVQVG